MQMIQTVRSFLSPAACVSGFRALAQSARLFVSMQPSIVSGFKGHTESLTNVSDKCTKALLMRPRMNADQVLSHAFSCRCSCGHTTPIFHQSLYSGSGTMHRWTSLPAVTVLPVRTYKVKVSLKRRCPSCYLVRKGNRLFIECKAKGRHKQMQKMHRNFLFRED